MSQYVTPDSLDVLSNFHFWVNEELVPHTITANFNTVKYLCTFWGQPNVTRESFTKPHKVRYYKFILDDDKQDGEVVLFDKQFLIPIHQNLDLGETK